MPKRTTTGTDRDTDVAAALSAVPQLDQKCQQILATLAALGESTAAGLAAHLGIGYSTTTPKLRKLNDHGLVEPGKADSGQTVWRLTRAGRTHPAAAGSDNGTTAYGADGTPTQDTAAVTTPAADADARTEQDVTTTTSSAAGDGDTPTIDEPATEADIADTVTDDSDATTDAVGETPTADSGDGACNDGDGRESAGEHDDTAQPTPSEAADEHASNGAGPAAAAHDDVPTPADAAPAVAPTRDTATGKVRRPRGSLDAAVLVILRARPDLVYKVGELCKLINKAEEGTGMPKASPGAVVLAAQRLVARQQAILAVEKPASFQILPRAIDHAGPAAQPGPAGGPSRAVDAVTAG
ncbi:hypothetical protein [Dactylosporangium matsuzakiense]|uniref:MarR family transcriptional regulator n=1 Tax=Dactylosporangium matsuzakiense TaxID=53360 RepID=A0A9W6KMB8_9ACTN|nr:hypothetical protein [Dactylosporangium matsuzakiense]UWZ44656.1 hypothetical protein Dmats_46210 [Dactylosporangium matsuzakiense]GLL04666.1 hypothetical protein GCM10017581_064130 [Dactylosporangium matsuzakiense]